MVERSMGNEILGINNMDHFVENPLKGHPSESLGPDVFPTKVGDHLKNWIPVFTENPGFRLPPE
jgi:hypothetical protein